MPDEPIVTPAPGEVTNPNPGGPVVADNPPQPSGEIPEKFLVNGRPDPLKIWESYQHVEREKGRLGSEVGELRKTKEEMAAWYQQNLQVIDENGQQRVVLKADWERQQAERREKEGLSEEEINARIQEEIDNGNFVGVLKAYGNEISTKTRQETIEEIERRNQVFSDPYLSSNPDVAARVKVLIKEGTEPDLAINAAIGEKARGVLKSNNPGGLPPIPSFTPRAPSSFISPPGVPPAPAPASVLTPEQLEYARSRNPGLSDAEIEAKLAPHVKSDWTK